MAKNCTLEKIEIHQKEDTSRYGVFLWNDDITPFDFVIMVLMEVFDKPVGEAIQLTMDIHNSDKGLVSLYTDMDIAYDKVDEVDKLKSEFGFSLLVTVEEM